MNENFIAIYGSQELQILELKLPIARDNRIHNKFFTCDINGKMNKEQIETIIGKNKLIQQTSHTRNNNGNTDELSYFAGMPLSDW